jgi:hypothetical protein
MAAYLGRLEVVQRLVKELGANVNIVDKEGCTRLYLAAQNGQLAVVRCLVKDLGADVNHRDIYGCTPLYIVAQMSGQLEMARCLVDELGAHVNEAAKDGSTPLMTAQRNVYIIFNNTIVRYLLVLKRGADAQVSHHEHGTAGDEKAGDPAKETAYLYARTHCANRICTNAGLKKCERCLRVYFCGSACIRVHWPAHKAECTPAAAKLQVEGRWRSFFIVILVTLSIRTNTFIAMTATFSNVKCLETAAEIVCCLLLSTVYSLKSIFKFFFVY